MPHAEPPVTEAERRAWSYWFVDGLPNLLAGLLCLLVSVTLILFLQYGPSLPASVMVVAGVFVFTAIVYKSRQMLEWLKSRITYPRTGYAAPPYFTEEVSAAPADLVMLNLSRVRQKETSGPLLVAEDLRWRMWVALAVVFAEPLAGKFIPSHLLCAAAGGVAGLFLWLVSQKDPRKSWAVVWGLFFAQIFAFNFLDRPQMEGAIYFLAGVGFALAAAGAIVLARYLRHNPVRQA